MLLTSNDSDSSSGSPLCDSLVLDRGGKFSGRVRTVGKNNFDVQCKLQLILLRGTKQLSLYHRYAQQVHTYIIPQSDGPTMYRVNLLIISAVQ